MPTPTTAKPNNRARTRGAIATWALAAAQLVSWGSIYYAFSLFVVPMESAMGWSRMATNAALSCGLLVSGLAAYPIGTWIDHGHGRRVMVLGSGLAASMLALWSQAHSPRDAVCRLGGHRRCDGCDALRSGFRGDHA